MEIESRFTVFWLSTLQNFYTVIGYNKGGLLETMIPYCGDARSATALFFDEQNEESIIAAVEQFNGLEFDSGFIKRYSERFDVPFFKDKIRSIVFENEN